MNDIVEGLKSLLEEVRGEKDQIQKQLASLDERLVQLTAEANGITVTIRSYQERHSLKTETAPAPIDTSLIQGARTQHEALILLAEAEPTHIVKPATAWPFLIAAGLMKPVEPRRAYVTVYTCLARSREFQAIGSGQFKLREISKPDPDYWRCPDGRRHEWEYIRKPDGNGVYMCRNCPMQTDKTTLKAKTDTGPPLNGSRPADTLPLLIPQEK